MDKQQMITAVASSSNSSSVTSPKKYDVFLSFRGEDTRRNFTSHLYEALMQKKVVTYIDCWLEKGDEISPALIKAIEDSHMSIVIFSENYASSKWCLGELSKIVECKKEQGQVVIPVFYNIDPSHVRKQTRSYEQAFAKHEGDLRCDEWKAALTEAANLAGWDSQTFGTDSEFIKHIVHHVLRKLTHRYPNQLKGLVGIEKNYALVESLLKIGSSEVRILGIWGIGGIGKTTLCNALYAKLSYQFEGCYFLANVREQSDKHGLNALRNKLFSKLLENENHCFDATLLVPGFGLSRLGRKKVFIVLDDVATSEQLENLIDYDFLGAGSRVIVTTRNKQIFSQVDKIYEVKELSFHHSLQLFSSTVFREKQPKHGYEDLSIHAISYCKGNPLALKVLGARLRSRSKEAWESELEKLQKIPNLEIQKVLKLSYDDLDAFQKAIFLDIACFLKGMQRDKVTSLLEACGFYAACGMEALLDQALITISDFNTLEMHDLIQEMGREIVRQESIKDPGSRSRLWEHHEVRDVLKYNRGTDVVESITLDLSTLTEPLYLSSDSFERMTNLRFLRIHQLRLGNERCNVYFPNGLGSLSDKLRYLRWEGFCLESLPSNFCAEQLVELRMPHSKLKKLWDGVQNLVNLKTIYLCDCQYLIEIPDLSEATNLENVCLDYCESLHELHPSMLSLPKLTSLYLNSCKGIESIKFNVHCKSLREVHLGKCSSLKEFSVTTEEMDLSGCTPHNASKLLLNLSETDIESLPANIKNLSPGLPPPLRLLNACNCTSLETDFLQWLVLQHMLQSLIPYLHEQCLHGEYGHEYFVFPGDHVTDERGFRTEKSSITIPYLPKDLWGFIYCTILSKGFYDILSCSVYNDGEKVCGSRRVFCDFLSSDHVKFWYQDVREFGAYDHFSNISFEFKLRRDRQGQDGIKGCAIFPVYASKSGLKLLSSSSQEIFESESNTRISVNESQPRAIGVRGSNNENEEDWE